MSKLRRIVLLRHGETVGNSKERFHGSSDLPLSDEGRAQMRAATRRLAGEVFVIDPDLCSKCVGFYNSQKCAEACQYEAIDLDMQPQTFTYQVGSIVLAGGWELYLPLPLPFPFPPPRFPPPPPPPPPEEGFPLEP